jgi:hypothetical protein
MVRLHKESSRSYSGRPVLASTAETPGTAIREGRCGSTGVSRGRSTGRHEPVNTPEGLTTREGLNLAGSTTVAERRLAMKPNGGAGSRVRAAEKECCSILRDCQEPPDADPHVRWCGGREVNPPGYPIRHHLCVLLVIFFVPGRMPREPRLNPTSGLPKEITAQAIPTPIGIIG